MSDNRIVSLDVRRQYPAPVFPVVPIPDGVWRNGMIVRMPNHLGDAVMALPALGLLRKIVPEGCALHVLAPEGMRGLYERLPMVDGFVGLHRAHRMWSLDELDEVRALRVGVGVLFTNSFRDALLLRIVGPGYLYGAAARWRSPLLARAFHFGKRGNSRFAGEHQTNRCIALARGLGAPEWDGGLPEFRFKIEPEEFSPLLTSLLAHPKLLCLAPGAAYGPAKRWPQANFRSVAADWLAHGGVVAVAGSAAETGIGNAVLAGLDPRKAFNLCGRTALPELMRLLRSARLTVANDSGIMHLAAALGRPGVAIFGSTDYTATGPISPAWRLVIGSADCAPCFKRECPNGGARCLNDISVAEVDAEIRRVCSVAGYPME